MNNKNFPLYRFKKKKMSICQLVPIYEYNINVFYHDLETFVSDLNTFKVDINSKVTLFTI